VHKANVNVAASANDEELIAGTIDGLQKLVLPFGDVRISGQFRSEKLCTDLFEYKVDRRSTRQITGGTVRRNGSWE